MVFYMILSKLCVACFSLILRLIVACFLLVFRQFFAVFEEKGWQHCLEHVLFSCRTALTQRRFTWRHDKVLRKLAHHVELKRVNAKISQNEKSEKRYHRILENRTNNTQEN